MIKCTKMICVTIVALIILTICMSTASAVINPPTNVKSSLHGNILTTSWIKSTSKNVTQYRIHLYKNGTTLITSLTKYVDANTISTTIVIPTVNVCYSTRVSAMIGSSISSSTTSNTVCDHTIKFVTIGDVHIGGSNTLTTFIPTPAYISVGKSIYSDGSTNFTKAINYVNNMSNVDFVVQLGDIVDSSSVINFNAANRSLHNFKKIYYVVEGNHDIGTPSGINFRKYIGPTDRLIKDFKGYQLIFPGIDKGSNLNISAYSWIFNYGTANKSKDTVVFNHGPVKTNPKSTSADCVKSWDLNNSAYYGYACSMSSELDKFTNLLGVYAGHVHTYTNKMIGNTLYVTEDNLGGNGPAADYIGYTIAQNGVLTYSRIYFK